MSDYRAPIRDMQFVVKELIGLKSVTSLAAFAEVDTDLFDSILAESAKFAAGVLAPLNRVGDKAGAKLHDGVVSTPPGFKDAYRQFVDAGWNGIGADRDHGGQGLPGLVASPVQEMWHAANMAFTLCPLLTQGAIEAIKLCGSPEHKVRYLPRMVTGEWTGTMNLTEPQAGSDLAAVRTRAVPEADHYKIFGQKIFITYGEHDYTDNIIHLVLARTPTAPEGVKGISLFLVPKFLVNADGSLGARNDVRCVSLEHKLGIHASPTAVLAYGDSGGAIGYLIGEENRGLEYMFIMMNLARYAVGLEGIGIAERAYQQARAYARERVQGVAAGGASKQRVTIVNHPDVRRMLMSMKAQIEAMRALTYFASATLDRAAHLENPEERKGSQALADLLIPIVKAWNTELAIEIASTGVQIHGGMGFIEETGAAQHLRDARITTIYEGTTGIQANDLIGRKLVREGGATMNLVIADLQERARSLKQQAGLEAIGQALEAAIGDLAQATRWLLEISPKDPRAGAAGAVPYLKLCGTVLGGAQMAQAAAIASAELKRGSSETAFYQGKLATAQFYASCILPQSAGLRHGIMHGAAPVLQLSEEQF